MKELTFETEYQLREFREIQSEYFNENGKTHFKDVRTNIMERMLTLINQLEIELSNQ